MTTGKISKYLKKEGDQLNVGDILCEIDTDKASVGYEIQEKGWVAKIVKHAGESGDVGEIIAIVVDEKEDVSKFADWVQESAVK